MVNSKFQCLLSCGYFSYLAYVHANCRAVLGRDIDRLFTAVVFSELPDILVPILLPLSGTHWLAALVLYDYTLTIGQEIELFWKRSWRSWTFFLFIANRYITVFGRVPLLVYSFWSSEIDSDLSVGHGPC